MQGLKSAGALLNSPGLMDWVKPYRAPVPSATQTLGWNSLSLSPGAEEGLLVSLCFVFHVGVGSGRLSSPRNGIHELLSLAGLLLCLF